jgi:hypothetical protein
MSIDRAVMALAGCFILISLLLSQLHSIHWLWFTAFVGANLCPSALVLKKLGVKAGRAFS